jgi:hypothetical protein
MRPNQSLQPTAVHVYEVRPRNDHRGVDLISEDKPAPHIGATAPETFLKQTA